MKTYINILIEEDPYYYKPLIDSLKFIYYKYGFYFNKEIKYSSDNITTVLNYYHRLFDNMRQDGYMINNVSQNIELQELANKLFKNF